MTLRIVVVEGLPAETVEALSRVRDDVEIVGPLEPSEASRRVSDGAADAVAFDAGAGWGESGVPLVDVVSHELSRAIRYRHPLSIMRIAVDGPDRLERTYGMDRVRMYVNELDEVLRRSLRQMDLLARTGAHDFSAILPDTAAAGGRIVAERLRAIADHLIVKSPDGGGRPALPMKGTCSIGLADGPGPGADTATSLVARSERALARAASAGPGGIEIEALEP